MNVENHPVVSREEWLAARRQHLAHEKAFTRERDKLSAERRALPWVKIDKPYRFQGPHGELSLADLFGGRSQLIVYHFMFGPGWTEGCQGCSFLSDHIDGANQHLAHHDVAVVAVSRAPFAEFQAFKRRMGWAFDWVSSNGCDFNYDFGVSFKTEDTATGKAYAIHEPHILKVGRIAILVFAACSSTAARLRSLLLRRLAATVQVRGAATHRALGRWL